jgi:hypothetical protein
MAQAFLSAIQWRAAGSAPVPTAIQINRDFSNNMDESYEYLIRECTEAGQPWLAAFFYRLAKHLNTTYFPFTKNPLKYLTAVHVVGADGRTIKSVGFQSKAAPIAEEELVVSSSVFNEPVRGATQALFTFDELSRQAVEECLTAAELAAMKEILGRVRENAHHVFKENGEPFVTRTKLWTVNMELAFEVLGFSVKVDSMDDLSDDEKEEVRREGAVQIIFDL